MATRKSRTAPVVPATPVVSSNLARLEALKAKAVKAEGLDKYKRDVKSFCDFMLVCAHELQALPNPTPEQNLMVLDCLSACPETVKLGGKHRHAFLEFCKDESAL